MQEVVEIRNLRSEIGDQMKQCGYTLTKLSELTGVRLGYLSQILNRKPPRPMTIILLDTIAKALHRNPGWLYELYPEECYSDEKVSRPRMIPFLMRCAELGQFDLITAVASRLLENPKNTEIFFLAAERLFEKGLQNEAIHFYRLVIDNERDSFHERFIISQYRLFRASLGKDAEQNKEAIIRFEPYYNRLAEDFQLDAILQLANIYYTLQDWEKVEKFGDELKELAVKVYREQLRKRSSHKAIEPLKSERHLVVYYGHGLRIKGFILTMQEQYEEAKKCFAEYSDLGWFEFLDDTGQKEVEKFHIWGKGNMYALEIKTGNEKILYEYVDFLDKQPAEFLGGALSIIQAANKFNFTIDDILENLAKKLPPLYSDVNFIDGTQLFIFWYEKAKYSFKNGKKEVGINDLFSALYLAEKMQYTSGFKKLILLMLDEMKKSI